MLAIVAVVASESCIAGVCRLELVGSRTESAFVAISSAARMSCMQHKLVILSAVLILSWAAHVSGATSWQFYVWNGLNDQLEVEDEDPQGPNNFIVFSRDHTSLTDYEETVTLTPDPHGEDDADCEIEVPLLKPELKFRDAAANYPEGYVLYVYKQGLFGPNDIQGTGSDAIATWPSQCVFH